MSPLNIAKGVVTFVAASGVGAIVGNAIKSGLPAPANLYQRLAFGLGGLVITSVVMDKAHDYAKRQFDETTEEIRELKNELKTSKED